MGSIGFIGFGNMGKAIAEGLIKSGNYSKKDFLVAVKTEKSKRTLLNEGWKVLPPEEVVEKADKIFLTVKPKDGPKVLEPLKNLLKEKLLISTLAGVSLKILKTWSPYSFNVRTMPNINVSVGKGVWGITFEADFPEGLKNDVLNLLSKTGLVLEIEEKLMNSITALAGSGPAFVSEILDAFAQAGVKLGFKYEDALKIALYTFSGTLDYIDEKSIHPIQMRDRVTSPAGTTIYGLSVLNDRGVKGAIVQTVETAKKRADELS
jgi:pyrroline-5-carboxylate reductase